MRPHDQLPPYWSSPSRCLMGSSDSTQLEGDSSPCLNLQCLSRVTWHSATVAKIWGHHWLFPLHFPLSSNTKVCWFDCLLAISMAPSGLRLPSPLSVWDRSFLIAHHSSTPAPSSQPPQRRQSWLNPPPSPLALWVKFRLPNMGHVAFCHLACTHSSLAMPFQCPELSPPLLIGPAFTWPAFYSWPKFLFLLESLLLPSLWHLVPLYDPSVLTLHLWATLLTLYSNCLINEISTQE